MNTPQYDVIVEDYIFIFNELKWFLYIEILNSLENNSKTFQYLIIKESLEGIFDISTGLEIDKEQLENINHNVMNYLCGIILEKNQFTEAQLKEYDIIIKRYFNNKNTNQYIDTRIIKYSILLKNSGISENMLNEMTYKDFQIFKLIEKNIK